MSGCLILELLLIPFLFILSSVSWDVLDIMFMDKGRKLQQFRWKLRSTNVHLQGWKVRKHMQLRTLTQHCLRWVTYVHWTMDIVQFKNVQNYGFQWQWHLPRDFLGAPHPNMGEPVISRIGHCTKGASANPQERISHSPLQLSSKCFFSNSGFLGLAGRIIPAI